MSPLDQARVRRVVDAMIPRAPESTYRLVGTASCVLRGIEMPASDIDVLFRDRDAIDAWVEALSGSIDVLDPPRWLDDVGQYLARLRIDGVRVELSTVEIDADTDTAECVGSGPWEHFDIVPCGAYDVPAVALELRLITEISRQRADRFEPLIGYLRAHPCDLTLIERGLAAQSTSPDDIERLIAHLSGARAARRSFDGSV